MSSASASPSSRSAGAHARSRWRSAERRRPGTDGWPPPARTASASARTASAAARASRAGQPRATRPSMTGPTSRRIECSARAGRRRPESVLELQGDPGSTLAPDAGRLRQGHEVVGGHRCPQLVHRQDGEDRLGGARTDAGDGLQHLEGLPLVLVGEPEQRQGVLPHDQRRGHLGRCARTQLGEGTRTAEHRQAHPADVDHGVVDAHRGDGPVHEGDHRAPPARGATRGIRDGCGAGHRQLDPRIGRPTPEMADGQCQGIGGVHRPGCGLEARGSA